MVSDLARRVEADAAPAPAVTSDVRNAIPQAEVSSAPEATPAKDDAVDPGKARALATIAALEQWLHAVHVARAQRCA
jgi:hypothetical protein